VLEEGMRRAELKELNAMIATALVMGPVVQAATFRAYGRIDGPLLQSAEAITAGIWAAIGNRGNEE